MSYILRALGVIFLMQTTDFSKADALFAKRENNLEAIHAAQGIYEKILDSSVSANDKKRAMDQLGKLAYYEGELLTSQDNKSRRMEIFSRSQANAEKAGSAYWKALSLALWSESAGAVSAWWYLDDFKDAMNRALKEDQQTDDGGIFRLLGALYVKSKDLESYGLYDPKLALEYAEKALVLSPRHLQAYLIKADVLRELGRVEEAKQFVKKTLENFHFVPELEPENKVILERMKK